MEYLNFLDLGVLTY